MSDPREVAPGPSTGASIPFRPRRDDGPDRERPRKRLAPWSRIGAAVAGGILLLVVLAWISSRVGAWLAAREGYQCAFREIRLDPPPPDYIAVDASTLLEQVRAKAQLPEKISILDPDLDGLRKALALHGPWFEKVERVIVEHPNIIRAKVAYRRPVARVPRPKQADRSLLPDTTDLIVDAQSVFLPTAELTASTPLIWISPFNKREPQLEVPIPPDPKPGTVWVRPAPAETRVGIAERRILDATALATFLLDHRPVAGQDEPARAWVNQLLINPTDPRGLFILARKNTWAFWGVPVGREPPGSPGAEQKWEHLRDWIRESRKQQPRDSGPESTIYDLGTGTIVPTSSNPSGG